MPETVLGDAPSAATQMVAAITDAIATTADAALVGLYLCGSLVAGDFDLRISDIDMVAVLRDELTAEMAVALEEMHDDLAARHTQWRDRIEVVYVPAPGLARFRTSTLRIGVISPGEPFHVIDAAADWVLTWYPVRQKSVVLAGPPVTDVIPDIVFDEFRDAVRAHLQGFTARIGDDASPGSQAYAVLTMCRGLYACVHGERVSKLVAAAWARAEFPQWASLIDDAMVWRQHQWDVPQRDGSTTVGEVRRFVAEMADRATAL